MKTMIDNSAGIGLVAMFHSSLLELQRTSRSSGIASGQQILDEQIAWVKGQDTNYKSIDLDDLPPRTAKEQADMEWDEALMTSSE